MNIVSGLLIIIGSSFIQGPSRYIFAFFGGFILGQGIGEWIAKKRDEEGE